MNKQNFIKISVWGIKTFKPKDIESYHDKYPFVEVPDRLFRKWFETKLNRKNSEYHTFRGEGFEDIVEFLKDLLDYYERVDRDTYDKLIHDDMKNLF